MTAGDRGFLNLPERREAVLAERLATPNINALVGNRATGDRSVAVDEVVRRLGELGALADGSGVSLLVEPLNNLDSPTRGLPRVVTLRSR